MKRIEENRMFFEKIRRFSELFRKMQKFKKKMTSKFEVIWLVFACFTVLAE